MHPGSPELAIMHAADERRVLAGHRRLVAVAVERPGLHLSLVELAAVQEVMERVKIMVTLRPDAADFSFDLARRQWWLATAPLSRLLFETDRIHRRTSMPS